MLLTITLTVRAQTVIVNDGHHVAKIYVFNTLWKQCWLSTVQGWIKKEEVSLVDVPGQAGECT